MVHRILLLPLLAALSLAPAAQAVDEDAVRQAVQRGVEFLRGQQERSSGSWHFPESPRAGATALAGLTLLECGVAEDDPAVQKAAEAVRPDSIELTHTYSLSLAILFLDRLGNPDDVALIESMAVRVMAGQNSQGGWTYECPPAGRDEVRRLKGLIRPTTGSSAPRAAMIPGGGTSRGRAGLPPEIQRQLRAINPALRPAFSDNSNTKFATLALWVARRHNIPVERALSQVQERFRGSQNPDGGWGYFVPLPGRPRRGSESTASMTCAGLLGLAVGVANEASLRTSGVGRDSRVARKPWRDPTKDPAVRAGLVLLGLVLSKPVAADRQGVLPLYGPPHGDEFYSLWALERVAVAYGLDTIGGKDWYSWGAEALLRRQTEDGGWQGRNGAAGVDTCFALLFLRRANLSKDLTVSLKGQVERSSTGMKSVQNERGGANENQSSRSNDVPPERKVMPMPPVTQKNDTGSPKTPAPDPGPVEVRQSSGDLASDTLKFRDQLTRAGPSVQEKLVLQFKDGKGVAYTQALAGAIPHLSGIVKDKARDALAERLARMTELTVRARLKDEDPEIRRAAALASAMKEDKGHVPDLIGLLEDRAPAVGRAAQAALRSLTGKDFGPPPGATKAERAKAVADWKRWWESQDHK
jgi:hypothetical protein